MRTDKTATYRLFDSAGTLLYVGVSKHWPTRMVQHAAEKAWWPEVASLTIQMHECRDAALQAEATAIRCEEPRHNGNGGQRRRDWEPPATGMPLRDGQVVALGLGTGDCPIGRVRTVDDEFVTLELYSFITKRFGYATRAYRVGFIQEISWAYWELVRRGQRDIYGLAYGSDTFVFDVDPLAWFQTDWLKKHSYLSAEEVPQRPVADGRGHHRDDDLADF